MQWQWIASIESTTIFGETETPWKINGKNEPQKFGGRMIFRISMKDDF